MPVRPGLPFLLFPAMAMWGGICWGEGAVWDGLRGAAATSDLAVMSLPALAVCAEGACAAVVVWRYGKGIPRQLAPTLVALAVAGILGGCLGVLCWSDLDAAARQLVSADDYELVVAGDPVLQPHGSYSLATLRAGGVSARVRVMWDDPDDALPVGACVRCAGTFSPYEPSEKTRRMHRALVAGRFNPGATDGSAWASSLQGAFGRVRQPCIEWLAARGGDGAAVLRGILLGDRSALSGTELDDAFKATGIAHMLAVSGTHLTVVALLISWLMERLGASRRASIVVLAATVVAYLVFTALQPSAFRACIMAVVASMSWFAGRRRSPTAALSLAVVGLLVLDPSNAFSIGFQLSVLGVAGLCVFLPLVIWWLERLVPRRLETLGQPLALTLTAQAATAPVAVPAFSMVSLVGPLANILVSPAIALLLGGGLVSLVVWLIAPALGQPLLAGMCLLADALARGVLALARLPVVAMPAYLDAHVALVTGACAAVVLWVKWPLPARRTITTIAVSSLCALAAVVVAMPVAGGANVVVMDIGQGDAILLSDGHDQVLVDTGPRDTDLRAALGRQGVRHLDAVVITHFDEDHCGALGALRSLVDVDHVIVADGALALVGADERAASVLSEAALLCGDDGIAEVRAGDTVRVSNRLELSVLWPRESIGESSNENSVCLLLSFDADRDGAPDHTMLLTGDAEHEQLASMVEAGLGDIEVLKVGHHGSKDAVDEEVLQALRPELALVSVGAGNSYGHPNPGTLAQLEESGARTYRTDEDGDIRLFFSPEETTVRCGG